MDCAECRRYLQSQLDERRAALTTMRVAGHLAECRHCRELYDLSESSWSGTAPSPFFGAPEGFAERVLNRVSAEKRRTNRNWLSLALALALGLPLGLAALALFSDSWRDPRPAAQKPPPHRPQLAQLMRQTERLKAMPWESLQFTAKLAAQTSDAALRLAPSFDQLPPVQDPLAAVQPIRHVGATLANAFTPVAVSAERAYGGLEGWLPRRKPK